MKFFLYFWFMQALFQSVAYYLNGFFLAYDAMTLFVLVAIFCGRPRRGNST